VEVVSVPIEQVKPYEKNPRKNDGAVASVANSIKEFGWQQPIVCDKDMIIIAGHTRYKAALRLGLDSVPVVVADGLTAEQVKAYRLADNKTGELAEWDFDLLRMELTGIGDIFTGFTAAEAAIFLSPDDIVEDNYEPEIPSAPETKFGEVVVLGNHRLMCGDCTDAESVSHLLEGRLVDCLVTDPPYNMGYEGAGGTKDRKTKRIKNDRLPEDVFFDLLFAAMKNAFVNSADGASFYVFYKELGRGVFLDAFSAAGITFRQQCVWVKNQIVLGGAAYQNMFEPFLYGTRGKAKTWNGARKQRSVIESTDFMEKPELIKTINDLSEILMADVIRENKPSASKLHPTMKPVRLLSRLMANSTDRGDIVFDPFAGSGSSMIAAEQLGRRCYMMELDEGYCDVIVDRWESFTGNKAHRIPIKGV
jgi:DNA modification methylase